MIWLESQRDTEEIAHSLGVGGVVSWVVLWIWNGTRSKRGILFPGARAGGFPVYYWLVRVNASKAVRDLRDPVESRALIFPGAWDRDFSVVPQS